MTEQTYFQEYWEKKGISRNKARRQRYKEDPEYRALAKERSREYWRKRRKPSVTPADQTMVVAADGMRYGTVSRVAVLINRSAFTVRSYCRRGMIPAATFYGEHGAKLFSQEQLTLLVKTFKAFDAGEVKSLAEAALILKRGWKGAKETK